MTRFTKIHDPYEINYKGADYFQQMYVKFPQNEQFQFVDITVCVWLIQEGLWVCDMIFKCIRLL